MAAPTLAFDNSYARLPGEFHARLRPTPVSRPRLLLFNDALAAELGMDRAGTDAQALAEVFSGNRIPEGAEPISCVYAGHQFGGFSPRLGDGRAILLGEVIGRDGQRRDIQLKGSGPTPYSRRGDGRAAVGPVLREYLMSEFLHALGIPTTRALAAVATGDPVYREGRLPGAVLTRVAASHIRVGTFQYFAARGDTGSLRTLGEHVLARHYPQARDTSRPYQALLQSFAQRHASLVAQWMAVGFIHGVMNTDNMSVSGETIDFGPCAFLEAYDPAAVFSAIDEGGRYAYANQPWAAQWNLARFAEALLPLLDDDPQHASAFAQEVINAFPGQFEAQWLAAMRAKLGLLEPRPDDADLIGKLLDAMHAGGADFTLTFHRLRAAAAGQDGVPGPRELFAKPESYDAWAQEWSARLRSEGAATQERARVMGLANPAIIARNHRVEQAIQSCVADEDIKPATTLLAALLQPHEASLEARHFMAPALPAERVTRTFCGT